MWPKTDLQLGSVWPLCASGQSYSNFGFEGVFSTGFTDTTSLRSKHPQILQAALFYNPAFSKNLSEFLTTFIFLWTFISEEVPICICIWRHAPMSLPHPFEMLVHMDLSCRKISRETSVSLWFDCMCANEWNLPCNLTGNSYITLFCYATCSQFDLLQDVHVQSQVTKKKHHKKNKKQVMSNPSKAKHRSGNCLSVCFV